MADEPVQITDPYQTPVIFVSQTVGTGFLNGVCNVTFATARFTPVEGKITPDLVISARLRMDLFCVQQLRDQLDSILAQNMKTTGGVQ